MNLIDRLIEAGGIKHYIKKWLHCRNDHDWRDANGERNWEYRG